MIFKADIAIDYSLLYVAMHLSCSSHSYEHSLISCELVCSKLTGWWIR